MANKQFPKENPNKPFQKEYNPKEHEHKEQPNKNQPHREHVEKDQAAENIKIAKRLYSEVYSRPESTNLLNQLVANNVILHDPAYPHHPEGLEDFIATEAAYQRAVPNKKTTVYDLFAAGDKVVARWTCHGTQEREFQGLKPTEKDFKVSGISIYRFSDGKITEVWQHWDRLSILEQVGEITPSKVLH